MFMICFGLVVTGGCQFGLPAMLPVWIASDAASLDFQRCCNVHCFPAMLPVWTTCDAWIAFRRLPVWIASDAAIVDLKRCCQLGFPAMLTVWISSDATSLAGQRCYQFRFPAMLQGALLPGHAARMGYLRCSGLDCLQRLPVWIASDAANLDFQRCYHCGFKATLPI